jgi:cytochrome b
MQADADRVEPLRGRAHAEALMSQAEYALRLFYGLFAPESIRFSRWVTLRVANTVPA